MTTKLQGILVPALTAVTENLRIRSGTNNQHISNGSWKTDVTVSWCSERPQKQILFLSSSAGDFSNKLSARDQSAKAADWNRLLRSFRLP